MSGLVRTPLPLILACVLGGILAGGVLGLVALLLRRPHLAPALLLMGAVTLEGFWAASKHLAGINQGIGAAIALLFALASGIALARPEEERGFLARSGPLVALPAGTWLGATLTHDPWMLVASCASPLVWVAAERTLRRRPGGTLLLWASLVLLMGTAQIETRTKRPRLPPGPEPPESRGPDIVLLVIDTLRADALLPGAALESFGRAGTVFQRCESAAPWTLPAVSSLLTGLYPSQHGAVTAGTPLSGDVTTLAEMLRERGWATAAFTGGAFVGSAYGLDQGFEVFDSTRERRFERFGTRAPLTWRLAKNRFFPVHWLVRAVDESVGLAGIAAAAREWAARPDPRPRFLFLHTYQVHDYYIYDPDLDDGVLARSPGVSARFEGRLSVRPSELSQASQADLDHFRALYDGRVQAVESLFPRLHEELGALLGEDAIWIVTADHGEGFDAARGRVHHGGRLHEDLLHVPLLVQAPGRLPPGRVVDAPVRTIDLVPTLLELAGVPVPEGMAGASLLPALSGTAPFPRSAFAQELAHGYDLLSLQQDGLKWIRAPGHEELYDLASDPDELRPLQTEAPEALLQELQEFDLRYPSRERGRVEMDDSTLDHLQELGYVQGDEE